MIDELEADRSTNTKAWMESTEVLRTRLYVLDEQLKRLLDGYLSNAISLEEYQERKVTLLGDKQQVKVDIAAMKRNGAGWFEPAIRFVKALKEGGLLTIGGTDEQKRDFLKKIGSNRIITAGQIWLTPEKEWKLVVDQGRFVHHNAAPSFYDAASVGETNLYRNKSGRQDSNLRPLDPQKQFSLAKN